MPTSTARWAIPKWHYDAGGYDVYGIKFAIYLDPVRADSGALRVIPA